MTVYILQAHAEYEGFEIEGVFSTRDQAEAHQLARMARGAHVDWWEITEYEVDKPAI